MLSEEDHRYWAARAEAELARARSATSNEARRAHHQLAALYLNLVYGGDTRELRPDLQLVRA